MAWFNNDQLRAARASESRRDGGADAKRARLIACGADDAALAFAVSDRNWLPRQLRVIADLYRRKEGVKVNVKNAARRGALRCGQPFLLLALWLNGDRHLSDEVCGDLDLHLVGAELLQRLIQQDLVLLYVDAAALERFGDLLVGDGAEELPAFADLHPHGEGGGTDLLGVLLCLVLDTVDLGGARRDLGCNPGGRPADGRDGETVRDQEVPGVAPCDLLKLAGLADLRNVGGEDDLHIALLPGAGESPPRWFGDSRTLLKLPLDREQMFYETTQAEQMF